MIDSSNLAAAIQNQISTTVEQSIQNYVENIIQTLALDSAWISKIERQINESITEKFSRRVSLVDVDSLIANNIDQALDRYFTRTKKITGINDRAKKTQITVTDDSVKIADALETNTLLVQGSTEIKNTLVVQNLAVRGTIATDNRAWQQLADDIAARASATLTDQWRESLVKEVTKQIQDNGIEFDRVMVGGKPLIEQDRLSDAIQHSDLRSVGVLSSLAVSGAADIMNSLSVRLKRVGINTEHPEMALAVWDEETALMFGKHKEQTAYIGTSRPQKLVIGINRSPAIEIDEQSRITVKHLTVGRHRVCHEPECPNYSGTKGDIVFNSNPKGDGIWAWQCLGAFKWQPLRSA